MKGFTVTVMSSSRSILQRAGNSQPLSNAVQTANQEFASLNNIMQCAFLFHFRLFCFHDIWYQISNLQKDFLIPSKQPILLNITNSLYILQETLCVCVSLLPPSVTQMVASIHCILHLAFSTHYYLVKIQCKNIKRFPVYGCKLFQRLVCHHFSAHTSVKGISLFLRYYRNLYMHNFICKLNTSVA